MPSNQAPFEYFACVLYPDCEDHNKILEIIKNERRLFKEYIYILHDRDEVEEEEKDTITEKDDNGELNLKKKHYHVLFKYYTKKSENGMHARFGGKLSKIIGIRDYMDYGCYLTHTNPKAILENKVQYDYEELKGTKFFKVNLNKIQNPYFVQFSEIMNGIKNTRSGTLVEYLEQVEKYDDDYKDYIFNMVHKETRTITQIVNDIRSITIQNKIRKDY